MRTSIPSLLRRDVFLLSNKMKLLQLQNEKTSSIYLSMINKIRKRIQERGTEKAQLVKFFLY